MASGAAGAAASSSAAAAAAIARAIKASGAIVQVESHDFQILLDRMDEPLVVCAQGGFFSTSYRYLTSYKGLFFYTKTAVPLRLPAKVEVVTAQKIWIPG